MEKKYLKKVLAGVSITSLAAGITAAAMAAGGWGGKKQPVPAPSGLSGSPKGAVGTQDVKKEIPAPGYGEKVKEAVPGYGAPASGYGAPAPAYGQQKQEPAPEEATEEKGEGEPEEESGEKKVE